MFSKNSQSQNANLMRLAVEASPNGMLVIDDKGRILLINSSIELLFGYTKNELLNQPIEKLVPERFAHHHPRLRNSYLEEPITRSMGHGRDLYGKRKNGTEIPVEIGLNPIELDGQTLILASIVDITARKRSSEMIRLAVEAAPNGMVMTNASGDITLVNSQIENLFGYSREELIGMSIDVLVPNRFRDNHPRVRASYFHHPISRSMGKGRDLFALHKDGREFPVEIGLNPLHTDLGTMILASVVDITERKRNEESLRSALKEKEILLSEIHHRVKNNLQIIDSLIGMQADKVNNIQALNAFQESQNRVRSIAMIHQILYESQDFSKVEIKSVIQSLVDNLTQSYGVDSVQVSKNINVSSVHLPIDKSIPLGLIVNELVSNTLKHGFPDGRTGVLNLSIRQNESEEILFTIEDSGVGIDDDLDLDSSATLGLSLVQTLVDQLGGSLTIQRKNPTRFSILFPKHIA